MHMLQYRGIPTCTSQSVLVSPYRGYAWSSCIHWKPSWYTDGVNLHITVPHSPCRRRHTKRFLIARVLEFRINIWKIKKEKNPKSPCHSKRKMGTTLRAHPLFVMTRTKDFGDLLAWCSPCHVNTAEHTYTCHAVMWSGTRYEHQICHHFNINIHNGNCDTHSLNVDCLIQLV